MQHKPYCPSPTLCNCYEMGSLLVKEEAVYDVGDQVVAHQKNDNFHRLVHCCTPPQKVGLWFCKNKVAVLDNFTATYNEGVVNGVRVR